MLLLLVDLGRLRLVGGRLSRKRRIGTTVAAASDSSFDGPD